MRLSILLRTGASLALVGALHAPVHAQAIKITGVSAITARGEIPLESVIGVSQARHSSVWKAGFGVYNEAMLIEAPGDRSSVRLRQSDVQGFLVHSENDWPTLAGLLPSFDMRLLVVKKGKTRQYVTMEVGGVMVFTKEKNNSPKLLVDITQYDDHTAKIVPKMMPLLLGEYGFLSISDEVHDQPTQRYEDRRVNRKDLGHYRMYCFAIE